MKKRLWLLLAAFLTFGSFGVEKANTRESYEEQGYFEPADSVEYGSHAWYPGEFWEGWNVYDDWDKDIAVKLFKKSFYDTNFVINNVIIQQRYRIYDIGIRSLKGEVNLDAFNAFIFADSSHALKIDYAQDISGKPFASSIYEGLNKIKLVRDSYGHYFDPVTATPSRYNTIRRKLPVLIEECWMEKFRGPMYILYPNDKAPHKYVIDNTVNFK